MLIPTKEMQIFVDFAQMCNKNSFRKSASQYANQLGNDCTLERERNLHLEETEHAIQKLGCMKDMYQMQTFMRKCPIPVQWFVLERVLLLVIAFKDTGFCTTLKSLEPPAQMLADILLRMWDEYVQYLAEHKMTVSNCLYQVTQ